MSLYPYNVYREQLTSLYHGHALWDPDPAGRYEQVSVGDVGYVQNGTFVRMFNVLLEWNDPSNRIFCQPEHYPRLDLGPFINIRKTSFSKGEYYSRYVTAIHGTTYSVAATSDNSPGTTYQCKKRGALLTLPYDGLRQDVIRPAIFEDYIRDHVDSWYSFAQKHRLGVERIEDLILVTGCTLVTSWGAAAFLDSPLGSEVSLKTQTLNNGGATFDWSEIRPSVAFHNSQQGPGNLRPNQCVFIRGFRAKRIFLWTRLMGAARPFPDDPDNNREDEMGITQAAPIPSYRDPVIGVLDYIAEKCPDNTVAIAHDDDLRLIMDVDILDADAVEGYLRQNEIGVVVTNGAATLHENEGSDIPDEAKATFYAEAELVGEPVPFILHPVLSNYLKLDITNQPLDHDHHLPDEDITSPAAHPPISWLKLENHQGYPQHIVIRSSDSPGTGITVQDVLRAIHEDMRTPSRRRDWTRLNAEERAAVDAAFSRRCRTQKELGRGPCRIDYLRGRNRLQILPKHSPHDDMLSVSNTASKL